MGLFDKYVVLFQPLNFLAYGINRPLNRLRGADRNKNHVSGNLLRCIDPVNIGAWHARPLRCRGLLRYPLDW